VRGQRQNGRWLARLTYAVRGYVNGRRGLLADRMELKAHGDKAVRELAATAEAAVSTAGTTGAADTEDGSTPTTTVLPANGAEHRYSEARRVI
jgi:hypothetical protein